MEVGSVQLDQTLVWFSVLAVEFMLGNSALLSKVNLVSEMRNASEFDCHELGALRVPFLYLSLALQL
jgi:hypothetical protein